MADPPSAPPDVLVFGVAHETEPVAGRPDFTAFVQLRTGPLIRSAYLLTGDQHLAEDLLQSAFARAHRAWRRITDIDHAEAYTRVAMYHIHVSWWRRRRPLETHDRDLTQLAEVGGGDTMAERVSARRALVAALNRLTPHQRAVLVLRYLEDYDEARVAEVLGVAVGTVKSQTSKALARLRVIAPELADIYFTRGTR